MRYLIAAIAVSLVSTPAFAQKRAEVSRAPSPLAMQAMQGDQPDVLLDIPNLSVDELTVDVANLDVNIALDARLANLLKLTAGADVHVDQVKIGLKGVKAQATLIVRLDNVRAIIERTLTTIEKNPQLVSGLLNSVNGTVGTVGGVANNALGTVGGVANNALGTVGGVTGSLLANGQVLDLARSGMTEVSRTVNSAGRTVRQVRNSSGQLLEVVTDRAGKIVSSRPL